jgi:hypothetical protein
VTAWLAQDTQSQCIHGGQCAVNCHKISICTYNWESVLLSHTNVDRTASIHVMLETGPGVTQSTACCCCEHFVHFKSFEILYRTCCCTLSNIIPFVFVLHELSGFLFSFSCTVHSFFIFYIPCVLFDFLICTETVTNSQQLIQITHYAATCSGPCFPPSDRTSVVA